MKPATKRPAPCEACADFKQRLSSMAIELVRTQDRLDIAVERLGEYDSDVLDMSKKQASEIARLYRFIGDIRKAHPMVRCADRECELCELLYAEPQLVRP